MTDFSTLTTFAWLCLALPLAGSVLIGFGWRVLPGRLPGAVGTLALAASFACAVLAFLELESLGEEERQVTSVAWDYARTVGLDAEMAILVDPLDRKSVV